MGRHATGEFSRGALCCVRYLTAGPPASSRLTSHLSANNIAAVVLDAVGRLIILRTQIYDTPAHIGLWQEWTPQRIMVAIVIFIQTLKLRGHEKGQIPGKMDSHKRGTHFFSLFGYHRNNLSVSTRFLALWHRSFTHHLSLQHPEIYAFERNNKKACDVLLQCQGLVRLQ